MCFRYGFLTLAALLFIGNTIGVCVKGNAAAEETKKSPASATATQVVTLTAADRAQVDKAQLDAWHANLSEWEEREPGEPADNSFCNVCHANLEDERLVEVHLPEGVGCETCHGISDTHSEDEDSLIPPDVMFVKSTVALFCIHCHDKDELIASERDHKDFFAAMDPSQTRAAKAPPSPNPSAEDGGGRCAIDDGPHDTRPNDSAVESKPDAERPKTCIGCHDFKHELKNRTRRWNKKTRTIEWYDGVRMMQTRHAE